jgi:hypothetical protein
MLDPGWVGFWTAAAGRRPEPRIEEQGGVRCAHRFQTAAAFGMEGNRGSL